MTMKDDLKGAMKARLGGGIAASKPTDSIFTSTAKSLPQEPVETRILPETRTLPSKLGVAEVKKKASVASKDTKSEVMDKVTLPMPYELRLSLEGLARSINRNNKKKQERITANTIARGFLHLVNVLEIDLSEIDSEKSLKEAILNAC